MPHLCKRPEFSPYPRGLDMHVANEEHNKILMLLTATITTKREPRNCTTKICDRISGTTTTFLT